MAREIIVQPSAARTLRKLPKDIQRRIGKRLDELAGDPRPADARLLKGGDDYLRVRVGDYRIVYTVHDKALLVLIVRIGHPREIYRKL